MLVARLLRGVQLPRIRSKLLVMSRPVTSTIKILIVVGLLAFLIGLHVINFKSAEGMDFEHYYVGAKMVAAGQGALEYAL